MSQNTSCVPDRAVTREPCGVKPVHRHADGRQSGSYVNCEPVIDVGRRDDDPNIIGATLYCTVHGPITWLAIDPIVDMGDAAILNHRWREHLDAQLTPNPLVEPETHLL